MGLLNISLFFSLLALLVYWIIKVIYSFYFSPLRDVPGPLVVHFFPYLRLIYVGLGIDPQMTHGYHLKYGPVVRIGPNVVSFCSEEAAKEMYSTYSYRKSESYEIFSESGATVFSTRDKEFHRKRKRILAPAYGQKPIENAESLVQEVGIQALANKIQSLSHLEKPINMLELFQHMAYDIIGELGFGRSFDMLKNGHHHISDWVNYNAKSAIIKGVIPFFKSWIDIGLDRLLTFSKETVVSGKSAESRTIILDPLTEVVDTETGEKLSDKEMALESLVQIIAGTDTTSNTLTWTFYLLLKNPQIQQTLYEVLEKAFPDINGSLDYHKCRNDIPYLSAVIHESMRLLPVISGMPMRECPPGGRTIDKYFIPEKTDVGVNILSLHNVPWNWKNPEVYDPTRWLDQDGNFIQRANFMPFLIGPRACLGRNLAWMELYLVVATLARRFKMTLHDKDLVLNPLSYVVTKPSKKELNVLVTLRN